MKNYRKLAILILAIGIWSCGYSGEKSKSSFVNPKPEIPVFKADTFNIVNFGAVNDGLSKNTKAINEAITKCSEQGGGTVFVPEGLWYTGPITMQNNVNLHVVAGAVVLFSTDFDDYPLVMSTFEGIADWRCMSPINGENLKNIAFTGKGVFDGSGEAWRHVKKSKLTASEWKKLVKSGGVLNKDKSIWYPSEKALAGEIAKPASDAPKEEFEKIKDFLRPVMLSLVSCKNVLLDGPTFQNSAAWCLHPLMCEDMTIQNVNVRNPWYAQNGDGIDLESCKNGIISNCTFDVGDDAICIKSGKDKYGRDRGMPTEDFLIEDCVVYHGHGGFTIGSEMSGGIKNMEVRNCTFLGTDIGLRFKSTRGRGGVVENIYISGITMVDIPAYAISFNLYYANNSPIPDEDQADDVNEVKNAEAKVVADETTPEFKNIHIENITCNGAMSALTVVGLPEMAVKNLRFENMMIKADRGVDLEYAEGVSFKNVEIISKNKEGFNAQNSTGLQFDNFVVNGKTIVK